MIQRKIVRKKTVIEKGSDSECENQNSRGEHQGFSILRNGKIRKQDLTGKDSTKKQQRDVRQ